ncbi:MAG: YDG domain-containing protein, partial [Thermoguttaceae bacterium]
MGKKIRERSLRLESLENRILLAVTAGIDTASATAMPPGTSAPLFATMFGDAVDPAVKPVSFAQVPDAAPAPTTGIDVETSIGITTTVPTVTEVDTVPTVSEVTRGETFYASVYVKSTDARYGVTGGYCRLDYDPTAFTAGAYIDSPIFPDLTINSGFDFSDTTQGYISAFGGVPSGISDAYGATQWALVGTQTFTADVTGIAYEFSTGVARDANGTEKYAWNFVREDYSTTYSAQVLFVTITLDVIDPDIEGVTLSDYNQTYDGAVHGITVSGTQPGDTILYSTDGSSYLTTPVEILFGSQHVYVKVQRSGYNDWLGEADISITPKQLTVTGTTVDSKTYDGTTDAAITLGAVDGVIGADDVTVTPSGAFPSADVGIYQVAVTYGLTGAAAGYYLAPAADSCAASITAADPLPDAYTLTGYSGTYDGAAHGITIEGLESGDTVQYSTNGVDYGTDAPEFFVGDVTVYVKISRANYTDWTG